MSGVATVLVANRGEIAVRIARTCRELGLRTVAVHSTADAGSAHAAYADEAICIGPAPARLSYNNIPAIIEAARMSGADLIHPGYGFLSENPDFAEVCEAEGFGFVGPSAAVMAQLADKAVARRTMGAAGLPLLPGSPDAVDGAAVGLEIAGHIGYPVIVKAVSGGGGRGMTVVDGPDAFADAYRRTRAEAAAVFGDDRVFVESYVQAARHVEVQVLCDGYGHGIHLGVRDCSVQRRRQKLVEETPAPGLSAPDAARLALSAVQALTAIGYVGAGTVEFVLDRAGNPSFTEVNCRLQVEHPVTEMVTGVDLVAEQLRIALGDPLRLRQDQIDPRGVSIECRINAEDPERGFVPSPATPAAVEFPGGPFVRVDSGLRAGSPVPAEYDSLLAKIVVWAADRGSAVRRMRRALGETTIVGPGLVTTRDFLLQVLDSPEFVSACHDTSLVESITETTAPRIDSGRS